MTSMILQAFVFGLALMVVIVNWWAIIMTFRLKREGSSEHRSLIHGVPQILVFVAAVIGFQQKLPLLPGWLLLLVIAVDPGTWSIAYQPIFLIRRWFSHRS